MLFRYQERKEAKISQKKKSCFVNNVSRRRQQVLNLCFVASLDAERGELTFTFIGTVSRGWFPWKLVEAGATAITWRAASVVLAVTLKPGVHRHKRQNTGYPLKLKTTKAVSSIVLSSTWFWVIFMKNWFLYLSFRCFAIITYKIISKKDAIILEIIYLRIYS